MRVDKPRRKILAASLMPAAIIGVPLALLLVSELRSLGHLEEATRQVLTQTGVRVSEEMAREIQQDLASGHRALLEAIQPEVVHAGDAATVLRVVAEAGDPTLVLGTLFLGSGPDDGGGFTALFDVGVEELRAMPVAAGWGAGLGLGAPERAGLRYVPGLSEAVTATMREIEAAGALWGCGFTEVGERRYALIARLFPGESQLESTWYVGYVVDTAELITSYFPGLGSKLRGSQWVYSTDLPLEVSIIDDKDREVFRTGPSLRNGYIHEASFPLLLLAPEHLIMSPDSLVTVPSWRVRAGYPGTDAAALARSSTNQQRQVLLLVSLIATVGIVLSGRAVARELGLAGMKAEFVSSVSHELKTPVASIQVLAEVLKNAAALPPEKVRGYGRMIGSEARRLGSMIEGMLEFEKINTGGRMYLVETIDLRDSLREAVGEHAASLKETGFRTEFRLPDEKVPFVGDPDGLCHAFANVVGNAIKYSGDGRYLRVALRLEGCNAVIEVEDRGIGIRAADRTKIFDRFYRVRRDAETDPTGTGLGLSIANHVVKSHGGRISVSGTVAEGSIFRIELPLDSDAPNLGVSG